MQECLRDATTVSQILARSLNSLQGGNNPRILEIAGKLQILQQLEVLSASEESINQSVDDNPLYVGITPNPLNRVEKEKDEKGKRNEKSKIGEKTGKRIQKDY